MFTNGFFSNKQRVLRVAALVLAIGLPLGLWVGGAQPVAVGLIPPPWDKLAHACVFAVLAACVGYGSGLRGKRMLLLAFGCALAVAVADEWHQVFLPGRSAGLDDLAADLIGAALGAWAIHVRRR